MGVLFWLSDEQWATIEPHLPKNQPGARRVDDQWVLFRHPPCPQDRLPVVRLSPKPMVGPRPSTIALAAGPAAVSGSVCWMLWPASYRKHHVFSPYLWSL